MLKQLATATALTGLMLAGAAAQSPTPQPGTMSPPAAQTDSKATTTTTITTGTSAQFIAAQKPDQWLGAKFKGTNVLGADNQKIGDVSDVLFDRDGGKIEAYVVSVGGFLGIGSKEVALAPGAFQVMPGDNGAAPKLKVSMTKDQLTQAPNFQPYKEPASTASSGMPRPSGGPGGMNR